ncbi:MAG TPA: hypothetical protein VKY65_17970 [Alphaproteobacteria bacterium]|nr:hypothetical protein [Alphaproteobacteria bacterium]
METMTQETLGLVRQAQQQAVTDPQQLALMKAWTQSGSAISGITAYDLEAPAKSLVPVITPLRNRIPRVGGGMGIQANWRAITGVNVNNAGVGVSEGVRGVVQAVSTQDNIAAYRGIGLEDYVTFEADYAAQGFDDVKAVATLNLLRALMIGEEKLLVGGNSSIALGTTPTPTLAAAATGGSLASGTLSVICVALTLEGFLAASVVGGLPLSGTRTLADGNTDSYNAGTAQKSANATVAVTGPTGSVTATVSVVNGAVAYAWFWGAAGSEALGAITTINSLAITASATGTQLASAGFAADFSQNGKVFDGLLAQVMRPGSNAYVAVQPTGTAGIGTPLTADGEGGIVEIDAALKSFWDNYRLTPTDIYVSSQEMMNISKKILQGGTNTAQRFVFQVSQGTIAGGVMVRSYLNKFTLDGAQEIPIRLHPNLPPGTLLFYAETIPYPLSNVANVVQVKTRRDYYQLEWPIRTRRYEYGVYADEVLQCYFPPAFGIIRNIANG